MDAADPGQPERKAQGLPQSPVAAEGLHSETIERQSGTAPPKHALTHE